MAKFRFQFETVLQQRRNVEDQRQRELAKSLRQRMILHNQLRSMQGVIVESKHNLRGGLVGAVDMNRVGQFARYSGQVAQRAQGIVLKLAAVEKQIDAARARLLEATRARRALDLLRDRHHQRWRREQDRREAAELDEVGATAYARRMAEEARA